MDLVNKEIQSLKEHMEKYATKEDLQEMKVSLIRVMFLLFIGQIIVLELIVLFVKIWVI
jgi:hypothetical protein